MRWYWWILIIVFIVLWFYSANRCANEIKERGLKSIVMEIWEGENK